MKVSHGEQGGQGKRIVPFSPHAPRWFNPGRVVYAAVMAGTLVWLGLIAAAPWLLVRGQIAGAALVYAGFSAICHQLPERSFRLWGQPLAVCARCTGIYAGFLAGLLVYPWVRRLADETFPDRRWLLLAAAPVVIDFAGGNLGLLPTTFGSRAATGALAGGAAAFYILPGFVSCFVSWFEGRTTQYGRS
jgi:uncharacterized membrane protein